VQLLTKLKSRGNAFSAIPCKELKFKKKMTETRSQRSQVNSQHNTSRNSSTLLGGRRSSFKLKEKSTFRDNLQSIDRKSSQE